MEVERIEKIESSIENLKNKKARIYFLVQDTKGNAKASIAHTYEMANVLYKKNYNVIIIHETQEYTGVSEWLGEEYMSIPHESIEGRNLSISPEDFIIIPELYGHVMDQLKTFPCGKIVLCQAYDYMLETLAPGVTWQQYGFAKVITTSEAQKTLVKEIMRNASIDVIEPILSTRFTKKEKPSKPIISIHTREPRDTAKIIKSFYLKFPQFRWITFRDMRGITQEDFAKFLKDSFVSIWVDDASGFGTFPLESMASGTPVIGKVPNLKPEWMEESNGIWTYQFNEIIDILANYTQNWLEDNISPELYEKMLETAQKYQDTKKYEESIVSTFDGYFEVRAKLFSDQLDKLKISEEQN
jgi:hypothetical protein